MLFVDGLEDKELPLVSHKEPSSSASLPTHAPSSGLLSMPLHAAKAEALAMWNF